MPSSVFDLEPDSKLKVNVICYGQVQSYIHITLPAKPCLKTNQNSTAILVLVRLCQMNGKDMSMELVWCEDLEMIQAFEIATINCVVGRVKVSSCWGIID